MEFTQSGLKAAGFGGFVSFGALDGHHAELSSPGVYAVLRPEGSDLLLTETSTGFWYQGRNPAYRLAKLQKRWDLPTPVLYIGKAGDIEGGGTTLWQRLQLFRRYGAGENVAHREAARFGRFTAPQANSAFVGWPLRAWTRNVSRASCWNFSRTSFEHSLWRTRRAGLLKV